MAVDEITRGEITMMYRQAADKRSQIKILSELYLISRAEVCKILFDAGYSDKYIKKHLGMKTASSSKKGKSAASKEWTSVDEDRLLSLRREKLSYNECARVLGRSRSAVSSKIYQLGI